MSIVANFDLYAPRLVNKEEYFVHGHRACQGCAEALAIRLMCKALGKDAVIINATGCMEVVSSLYPTTAWKLPWLHVAFPNSAAAGSGVSAALKVLRRKGKISDRPVKAVSIGGDGGTFDIGLQALSGAMERGHDLLYVCFDNEAYMNTGIQRSGATPFGASTTTHPAGPASTGKSAWKKNLTEIMIAHNVPYVATACPSYPIDFIRKVEKAKKVKGPAFIHVLAVCPTGWRCASEKAISMGRLASETGVFPIYEVVDGKYSLTIKHDKLRPVADYLKLQGRFRHLSPDMVKQVQERVVQEYNKLLDKVDNLHAWSELKG
ncbi:MAG: pyruvate synthase subunit beta [Deltaproteobacteria bacterium]|nr:pyruvate synthase subunit beta [Deltaproteobacteria bacterium]